jgi:hypothetical protein
MVNEMSGGNIPLYKAKRPPDSVETIFHAVSTMPRSDAPTCFRALMVSNGKPIIVPMIPAANPPIASSDSDLVEGSVIVWNQDQSKLACNVLIAF